MSSNSLCYYSRPLYAYGGPVFLVSRMIIILNRIWSIHFGSISGEAGGAIAVISLGMVFDVAQPPTNEQIVETITALKNDKPPGRDDLSVEFFSVSSRGCSSNITPTL